VGSQSDEDTGVSDGSVSNDRTPSCARSPSVEASGPHEQGETVATLRDCPSGGVQRSASGNQILPEGRDEGSREQPSNPGPTRKRPRLTLRRPPSSGPDTRRCGPAGGS